MIVKSGYLDGCDLDWVLFRIYSNSLSQTKAIGRLQEFNICLVNKGDQDLVFFADKIKQEDHKHMIRPGGKFNSATVYITLVFYLLT